MIMQTKHWVDLMITKNKQICTIYNVFSLYCRNRIFKSFCPLNLFRCCVSVGPILKNRRSEGTKVAAIYDNVLMIFTNKFKEINITK